MLACKVNNGAAQKVLGIGFDGTDSRQVLGEKQLFIVATRREGRLGVREQGVIEEPKIAVSHRAGFVQHQHIDLAHGFEGPAIADQQARLRSGADRGGNGQRGGQSERAGAGDDQNRGGAHQRRADAGVERGQKRKVAHGEQDHRGDEDARDAVHGALDGRAAAERPLHQADNLDQGALVAGAGGADLDYAARVEAPGNDLVAGPLGNGSGFSTQQRFIGVGFAFENDAIAHVGPIDPGPRWTQSARRPRISPAPSWA